jgi:putative ABC transport system ATP-binding protein
MQGYGVLPNFTVFQNVLMPHFFNRQQLNPEGRALYLLEQAGIAHLASRYPQRLSGGELRRVSIARALLNSPELLVADEPTSDLDVETTGEIMSFFASTARLGTAILMVSHEPDAAKYCDACYSMRSGSLEPF